MPTLQHKVAIVTGASSGIGRAAALLFASEGASVVIGARGADELAGVAREIETRGGRVSAIAGDIGDEATSQAMVDAATREFGGLDVAFNNAGGSGAMGPVDGITVDGWRETIETNLTSAFLCARHQVPAMTARGGGSMIFTSSFVGSTVGFPGMAAYAASKAGIVGLVQVLAAEYGALGIRANALLPGGTDTPSNAANQPGSGPETRAYIEGLHALKRLGTPEELANAALFLASDASSFVTGASFLVDGGLSISR